MTRISAYRYSLLVCSFMVLCLPLSQGFSITSTTTTTHRPSIRVSTSRRQRPISALQGFNNKNSNDERDSLKDEDVNVNLLPEVDALTLTAVGFSLIAFNFFVLANLGDGGIAGTVATIINRLKE